MVEKSSTFSKRQSSFFQDLVDGIYPDYPFELAAQDVVHSVLVHSGDSPCVLYLATNVFQHELGSFIRALCEDRQIEVCEDAELSMDLGCRVELRAVSVSDEYLGFLEYAKEYGENVSQDDFRILRLMRLYNGFLEKTS